MEIHIKTIPNDMMRIPGGIGDYWYDNEGVLQIRVIDMQNEFYEKMVCIHEMIEEALTKKRGVPEPDIQAFDEAFERARVMGLRTNDEEPGFSNDAPYLREHTLATSVEMMMCALAGESWTDYDRTVIGL